MKNKKLLMLSLIPLLATSISSCGDKNNDSSSEKEYSFSQEEEVLKMIPQEVLNAKEEIDLLVYIEGQDNNLLDIGNFSNDPNGLLLQVHLKRLLQE